MSKNNLNTNPKYLIKNRSQSKIIKNSLKASDMYLDNNVSMQTFKKYQESQKSNDHIGN